MGVFEDGFLGLNLDGDSPTLNIILLVGFSIVLLLQIVIGIIAFIKIARRDINKIISFLFVLSLFCALFYTATQYVKHTHMPITIHFFQSLSFGIFFLTLYATLIVRVHIIFKDSTYNMSWTLVIALSVIMVLCAVGWITYSILNVFTRVNRAAMFYFWYSIGLLYVIGSALVVFFFVSNLIKLAETRQTTPITTRHLTTSMDSSDDLKDIELNYHQRMLSDLAAKYVMLYAQAIASTVLLNIFALLVNNGSGLRSLFWSVDLAVNLWLLFLKFSFAKEHYNKCCRCCDRRCRTVMAGRTKSAIHQYSIIEMQNNEKDLNASEESLQYSTNGKV